MDFTKCRNKLVRYTHDDHWHDDAPAYCKEIVSRQEPCEVTRGALTDIKSPRIKAIPRHGVRAAQNQDTGMRNTQLNQKADESL